MVRRKLGPDQSEKISKRRKCFVVGPIGALNSSERTKADWLLRYIVRPVLEGNPFGYDVVRADEIAKPGLITDDVINCVLDADLVVADLSGANPNAFYELGLRHMNGGPTIHVIESGEEDLPFDVQDYRTIFYKTNHPDDIDKAKDDLVKQAVAIEAELEEGAPKFSNPVTRARGFEKISVEPDTTLEILETITSRLDRLERERRTEPLYAMGISPGATRRLAEEAWEMDDAERAIFIDTLTRRFQQSEMHPDFAPPPGSVSELTEMVTKSAKAARLFTNMYRSWVGRQKSLF